MARESALGQHAGQLRIRRITDGTGGSQVIQFNPTSRRPRGVLTRIGAQNMKKFRRYFPAVYAANAALLLGNATPLLAADDDEIPFSVGRVFFQLNDTDGDLGIHAKIDGEPWTRLKITGA